jgi:pimeloyl-ACP methyl ester carboxylesterase
MPVVKANNLDIEVETHGDPSDPAVVLIMGLAAQLIHWPPALIEALVTAGYRVVAFDNRDIGLSDKLEHLSAPSPALTFVSSVIGLGWMVAPYTLKNMAADTIGVLDALDIDRAHLLGVSMGGMIGQVAAAEHGKRLLSFTSIMSSTNNRELPRSNNGIVKRIVEARAKARSPEDMVERSMEILEMIGTPDGGREPAALRQIVEQGIQRCSYPAGVRRQIAAIVASGDLRRYARLIDVPTLVMHGDRDPLVPHAGSMDIAANVPGARLEIIEGMGHDLPPRHLDRISTLVIEHLDAVHASDSAAA